VNVGFYHAGESEQHLRLVRRLIDSVDMYMPGVGAVAFTEPVGDFLVAMLAPDMRVLMPPGAVALCCLEAFASVFGDWLFVDTDVEIRSDVRHVFEDKDFDIAVATREGTLLEKEVGTKFMARMPVNKGSVFSRSQAFWQACAEYCRTLPDKQQNWMGDQVAVNYVISSGQFKVKILPNAYNYPPKSKTDDLSGKHIVHYKGPNRKKWALEGAFA
jgi:hypothetical protein